MRPRLGIKSLPQQPPISVTPGSITAPILAQTSAAGTNRMSWSGTYTAAIQWDGVDTGDKEDMQWRVNGGAWNADTRQVLDSAALLSGSVPWPLFGATAFALNDFVEVQERTVRFVAGAVISTSSWSNTISDTMATGTAFDPATLFGASDVGYVWNPTDLAHVWQLNSGVTAGAFTSPVGRLDDLSGKGNNWNAQGNDTTRPTLQNVNNGLVTFDGSNDRLMNVGGFYAKGAMTWIAAIKATDTTAAFIWAESASGNTNPVYAPALRAATNNTNMLNWQRNDAATTINHSMVAALMTGTIHIYMVVDTGTQVQVSIDGGAFVNDPYTRAGTLTMNQSALGDAMNAGLTFTPLVGSVGAGIVIGRNLTGTLGTAGTERTNAYNWIAGKHGLTTL